MSVHGIRLCFTYNKSEAPSTDDRGFALVLESFDISDYSAWAIISCISTKILSILPIMERCIASERL